MSSSRKQILYLCLDRGIKIGGTKGASIHIAEFMEALHEGGHTGTILAARKDRDLSVSSLWDTQLISETRRSRSERFKELGEMSYAAQEAEEFFRNIESEAAVLKSWETRRFDLIYERYSLFGLAGHLAARELGVPHILEVNAPLVIEAAAHRNLSLADLARSVERTLFSSVDHVVAVSQQVKEYVQSVAPNAAVSVIPNGVNMRLFSGALSSELNGTADDRHMTIGFVGALKPWHGAHILVDAFARVASRLPDVMLRFVGDDSAMRDLLENQIRSCKIEGRVIFTGALPHEQIPAALTGLTIVTAPYPKLDNFYFSPLKVYEYMAAGRPIVASRIGQISDILSHEANCLLVEPGNPADLADALERLLNDAKLRVRLGTQARADAIKEHSWSSRMRDISRIFDTVCADDKETLRSNYADSI